MTRAEQIKVWGTLGTELKCLNGETEKSKYAEAWQIVASQAEQANSWFTGASLTTALLGISRMLETEQLEKWLSNYPEAGTDTGKKIGIIMAGNIPLAGFHDFMCVLLSGHTAVVKQSSSDRFLLPFIASILFDIEPKLKSQLVIADQLKEIDAIIATGSNNTARYFEYYFGKLPHIFRKNRNSAAVITGKENEYDFLLLGRDIFTYFGLGCRNVSKLYVPEGYRFDDLYAGLVEYGSLMQYSRYMNNHDYHQALFLLNNEEFLTNNFLIIRKEKSLSSPVGVLHYENYSNTEELNRVLDQQKELLQCVVRKNSAVSFGQAQFPNVWDYADGVDTMKFLSVLS